MILSDYRCPIHGTFEATVESPAPDEVECPTIHTAGYVQRDCGAKCGLPSRWVPAAIRGRVRLGEVVRGPNERPPNRLSLDTRKLGEGQPMHEYREERERIQQEFRRSEIKDWKEGR